MADSFFNPMVAFDPSSFAAMKGKTARDTAQNGDSPEALRQVAKQFEALFLQMVLKSMREATPKDSLLDSEETRMFQSLADEQLAMHLAEKQGVGLADAIVRQMSPYLKNSAPPKEASSNSAISSLFDDPQPAGAIGDKAKDSAARGDFLPLTTAKNAEDAPGSTTTAAPVSPRMRRLAPLRQTVKGLVEDVAELGEAAASHVQGLAGRARNFAREVWPHAKAVSARTGVPAAFIVAHAALETGWGRAILKNANGESTRNVFNIKAGRGWAGGSVSLPVTEYAQGRAYMEQASFRSYQSLADSFNDYAQMLTGNERYAGVLGQKSGSGFARALQDAGYATDPHYARKLSGLINSNVLKVALSGLQ